MNGAEPGLELTPGVAALSALAAGFAQLAIAVGLAAGMGWSLAVFALGGLVAYGVFFALLAPRLGDAPAARLGFVRPARGSALACALLLASVLLISEIDNLVRAVFPIPEAMRESLDSQLIARSAAGALREGVELVLVGVAVFPLIYEIFYRGLVQPAFVERFGAARGVCITAALEASSSLGNPLLLWTWPVVAARGLVLGILRQSSGSLLPSLALSALMGAVEAAARYELFGIAGFDDSAAPHTPAIWLAAASLPTAGGLWLCHLLGRAREATGG
jgi:membrane protease YdiL (CAAX protease family)